MEANKFHKKRNVFLFFIYNIYLKSPFRNILFKKKYKAFELNLLQPISKLFLQLLRDVFQMFINNYNI